MAKKQEPKTVITGNTFKVEPVIHNAHSIAGVIAIADAISINAQALFELSRALNGATATGIEIK